MLKSSVFHVLENMINRVLEKDGGSRQRLALLEDKIIILSITNIPSKIYFLFENQRVRLLSDWRGTTDARIEGPLSAFAQLALPEQKSVKEMIVSGDLAAIEALKKLFVELDINLAEQLAPLTGDALAFKIAKTAHSALQFFKRSAIGLRENSKEFLQEEAQIVPPKEMVDDFSKDVQKLNRETDRLAERIKLLQAKR